MGKMLDVIVATERYSDQPHMPSRLGILSFGGFAG